MVQVLQKEGDHFKLIFHELSDVFSQNLTDINLLVHKGPLPRGNENKLNQPPMYKD